MTNLRAKHDQIYNFPQQHIEPQVNWSTVIEEKQVPRGHQGHCLASNTSWAGSPAAPHGETGSWKTSGQLHTGSGKELGGRGGAEVMGQGWLLWHQKSVLRVALVLASASPALGSTPQPLFFILSHCLHSPSQRRV